MTDKNIRADHRAIVQMVSYRSRVLDLGCGNGELLHLLAAEKRVHGQGIEINEKAIYKCVARGLAVLHGDVDCGLSEYGDKTFDYVILNQSLQQIRHFETVFREALRVGKKVIVGFPNFAFYMARLQLCFLGKSPLTRSLPYFWYDSPNLHFFSIKDFVNYCRRRKIKIEGKRFLAKEKTIRFLPNLFADAGIFLISGQE